jgi:hypothetical protein
VHNADSSDGVAFVLGVFVLLLFSTERFFEFLRRYRRSAAIPLPRPQRADLIAVFMTAALLSFLIARSGLVDLSQMSAASKLALACSGALAGLWVVVLTVLSRIGQGQSQVAVPLETHKPYSDEPITTDAEDLLGRIEFVEGLYREIATLPFPDSFVFGLYGGWGEGKSSVLNLLASRLEAHSIVVRFNPWYFPNENALIRNFYDSIEEAVQKRFVLPGLRSFLDRYENLLTFGLGFEAFRLKLRVRDNPEELRADLESRLAALTIRLVILIDDVDRLQPTEMLAVLKLCRLSARVKNTVFVLSLDPTIVSTLIQHAGADPEYLEKIVQKPIPLPPAEQAAIDRYLLFSDPPHHGQASPARRSAIDVLLDAMDITPERRKDFDERFVAIYQQNLRRFFRTLRQVKRYLNGLQSTVPPVVAEVDLGDAFLLEFIQVFYPTIYQDIWRNRAVYLPARSFELMFLAPVGDGAKALEAVRSHIDALLGPVRERALIRAVLEDLFFVQVRNAYSQTQTHHTGEDRYRAQKRLTHPECFPKYFLLRAVSDDLSDLEVETVLREWEGSAEESLGDRVYADLQRYRDRNRLAEFVLRVRVFVERISALRVRMVLRGLCRMIPELRPPESRLLSTSEYDALEGMVYQLIERRASEQEVRPLIEEVAETVEQLYFAVALVLRCHRASQGSLFRIQEQVDLPRLRQIVADRLKQHYIEGSRDIFVERPRNEWALILYQWGTDWMTNSGEHRADVRGYVRKLIQAEPSYLGRVVAGFVERWPGSSPGFRWDEFTALYDGAEIGSLADDYGEVAGATEEEREGLRLFRLALERHRGKGSTSEP